MAYRTRNPHRFSQAVNNSGDIDIGAFRTVRGGMRVGTIWSGGIAPATRGLPGGAVSGNQIVVQSGQAGGILHTATPLEVMQSGVQIWFYDAAVVARSGAGPIVSLLAESGARVLGIIPTSHRARDAAGFQSGYGFSEPWQDVIDFGGVPYYSGLHISAASGAPGFSFSWSPDLNRSGSGNDEVG